MEQALHTTIVEFSREIAKLELKKPGAALALDINVAAPGRYDSGNRYKTKLSAHFYNGSDYETVRASSLGALMDEVYRRLGFADREAIKIDNLEASLVALAPPSDD